MPTISERVDEDLKNAMRAHDALKVSTLRLLRSAFKNAEIAARGPVSEEEMVKIVGKEAKKRKESIALFTQGGRPEKAHAEELELDILREFLPEQMSEQRVTEIIQRVIGETGATSAKDRGKVMGRVMQELKGRADGSEVQRITSRLLEQA